MKRTRMTLSKLLYPPKWILLLIPPLSFAALVFIFVLENTEGALAYGVYCMSAYSLVIWSAVVPNLIRRLKDSFHNSKAVQRLAQTNFGGRYLKDLAFRGSVSIYQGMLWQPAQPAMSTTRSRSRHASIPSATRASPCWKLPTSRSGRRPAHLCMQSRAPMRRISSQRSRAATTKLRQTVLTDQ